jgi:hypothetical protein
MAKFVALKDADGAEHILNIDHIIRIAGEGANRCTVVLAGYDLIMSESALAIWKKIAEIK